MLGACRKNLGNLSADDLLLGLKYTHKSQLKGLDTDTEKELLRLGFVRACDGEVQLSDEFVSVLSKFKNIFEPRKIFKVDENYIENIFAES